MKKSRFMKALCAMLLLCIMVPAVASAATVDMAYNSGALYLRKGSTIYAEGLKVPVGSTVGAGDSVVAALAYAESQDMSEEDAVRLSTATGAANVMCSGTQAAERSVIEELLPKVRFSKL